MFLRCHMLLLQLQCSEKKERKARISMSALQENDALLGEVLLKGQVPPYPTSQCLCSSLSCSSWPVSCQCRILEATGTCKVSGCLPFLERPKSCCSPMILTAPKPLAVSRGSMFCLIPLLSNRFSEVKSTMNCIHAVQKEDFVHINWIAFRSGVVVAQIFITFKSGVCQKLYFMLDGRDKQNNVPWSLKNFSHWSWTRGKAPYFLNVHKKKKFSQNQFHLGTGLFSKKKPTIYIYLLGIIRYVLFI